MNYLDILIIILLIIGGWRGFKKGLIIELFTLLALLVGIYAGIHFSDFMSSLLRKHAGITSEYLPVISFTIILLLVAALVFFAGKLIEGAVKTVALGPINKIAGLIFGLVKMLYIGSVVLVLLEGYDRDGEFIPEKTKNGSLLYEPVKQTSLKTIPALRHSEMFFKASDFVVGSAEIGDNFNVAGKTHGNRTAQGKSFNHTTLINRKNILSKIEMDLNLRYSPRI